MVRSHNEVFLIIHQRMEPILVGPVVSEDIVCGGGGEGAEEVIDQVATLLSWFCGESYHSFIFFL